MLFERLVLENYGVYADRSEMDLTTNTKKPIILVGGLNGAGKTTLFESIMIALYGRSYMGAKTTKSQYLAFVADRIHKHKNGRRAKHAFVEISFRFYHNGSEDTYVINRGWDVDGASVLETLKIHKNNQLMEDVDEALWQSFIEGLIPIGIARLFFFDGEKIVRVTKWNKGDNEELKLSLDVLFGTELISRLDADLDLYAMRKSGSTSEDATLRDQYDGMLKEKKLLVSEISDLEEEKNQKQEELDGAESEIAARELKIAGIGGGYSEIRGRLLSQKATIEEKLRHQNKDIQEELAGDAPLFLASDILKKIERQICWDTEIVHQKSSISYIAPRVQELKKDIATKEFWFEDAVNDAICAKISKRLDDMIKKPSKDEFFEMSLSEADGMRQKINDAKKGSKKLRVSIDAYARTKADLDRIDSELIRIPKDDELGPKISEINKMSQDVGILKAEIEHIDREILSKKSHQKVLQNRLKKLIDLLHRGKTSDRSLDLVTKMKKTLATYHKNLKQRKMRNLEANLLDTLRILLHKDMVSEIKIDPDTLEIQVYGSDSKEPIPGGLLSMGERQMVGTALLWALAKTCGRSLPFVIDTPLGRLDGEHLTNLTDKFYPFVSHQLILLSTDREIGDKEYDKMSRYISRSYHIEYNSKKSATSVKTGYFMERDKEVA